MKGICFKEHLFHATVAGTKTQTRRIIKIEDCSDRHKKLKGRADWYNEPMTLEKSSLFDDSNSYQCKYCGHPMSSLSNLNGIKPRYNEGEVVYLKESYVDDCLQGSIAYKYSKKDVEYLKNAGFEEDMKIPGFWKNKLFMPESVARHFIKITGTRIERLQDISDEDCIKEGIERFTKDETVFKYGIEGWKWDEMPRTPKEAYQALINQINGSSTWNDNPFVWVYDYELINVK